MWSFGKKRVSASVSKSTNPIETISTIREAIDNADKRGSYLQIRIDRLVADAKSKMAQGNKRGALYDMKKRKMLQEEIEKLDNVKMTLELQAMQLETAAHNTETVKIMQTGNSVMKRIRKATGLDKIDELMEDMRDEADTAQEISNAIATPLDPYMMDDAELLRELDELNGTSNMNKRPIKTAAATTASSYFFAKPSKKTETDAELLVAA
jgi:charged multivesicular body protein 4A/B